MESLLDPLSGGSHLSTLTATQALNKVTLSYIEDLANKGVENALIDDEHLRNGLNIQNGEITHPAVKDALNN